MHYSGILVTINRQLFSECLLELGRMQEVEVYHQEPDRGQAVIVQETKTTKAQEAGFKRIAELPQVLGIELVYNYHDTGDILPEDAKSNPPTRS